MIRHIIAANGGIKLKNEDYLITQEEFAQRYLEGYQGKMDIYFATTVSEENFKGFRPYLELEGLAYRLTGKSGVEQANIEKTIDLFYKTYRYTAIFKPQDFEFLRKILPNFEQRKKQGEFPDYEITRNHDIRRLLSNYAAGLAALGHHYLVKAEDLERKGGDRDSLKPIIREFYNKVEEYWHFGYLFRPDQGFRFLANLGVMKFHQGDYPAALKYFKELEKLRPDDPRFLVNLGEIYSRMGMDDKALSYFNRSLTRNPRDPEPYQALLRFYYTRGDTVGMKNVMAQWIRYHPTDTSAQDLLRQLLKQGIEPR